VIENMAPVLSRLFTPLFAAVLVTFLATMAWTGRGIHVERNVLVAFDLLLVLVLGLLLYAISARDPDAPAGGFDWLLVLLVISALLVDALALAAIVARISDFGLSPGGPRRERDLAREPGVVGTAIRAVPARARVVPGAGTVADRLSAGVRGMGGRRGPPLPPTVPLGPRRRKVRAPNANPCSFMPATP
jgi:hypothetical protein